MACPFFLPIEKLADAIWLHPARLPLGCGWSGQCTAPGHEGVVPSQEELHEFCNLGYAEACRRLPRERAWDSVRFGARVVAGEKSNGKAARVEVRYVCERGHRPAKHGTIEFDAVQERCAEPHPDGRLQRLAECFLESYLDRMKPRDMGRAAS
jgi:hypothetical protein